MGEGRRGDVAQSASASVCAQRGTAPRGQNAARGARARQGGRRESRGADRGAKGSAHPGLAARSIPHRSTADASDS
eukprot:5863028-Prymnesium_polylepis.1